MRTLGKIIFLPGHIILLFGFLFPKRGEYGASARRHESGCLAVVYSIMVYGVLAWLAYGYYHDGGASHRNSTAASLQATPPEDDADLPSTFEAASPTVAVEEPTDEHVAQSASPIEEATSSRESRPSAKVEQRTSTVERVIAASREIPEIDAAIKEAASSGEPKRWKTRDEAGYAVPSTAGANGCRQVRVSIDGQPIADAKLLMICPDSVSAL